MDIKNTFTILAGLLFLAGYIPYVLSMLRKDNPTKPIKASWMIWAGLDTITLVGMYLKHTLNGQMIGVVTGGWIVVLFTMKYGKPGWTKVDKCCLSGAIIGIILWQMFDNPTFAILMSVGTVFLASIPTFVSAWHDPDHEDKLAWTIFFVSCVCAVIAIPGFTLEEAMVRPAIFLVEHPADTAQPLTFLLIQSVMMYILYIRPRRIFV